MRHTATIDKLAVSIHVVRVGGNKLTEQIYKQIPVFTVDQAYHRWSNEWSDVLWPLSRMSIEVMGKVKTKTGYDLLWAIDSELRKMPVPEELSTSNIGDLRFRDGAIVCISMADVALWGKYQEIQNAFETYNIKQIYIAA